MCSTVQEQITTCGQNAIVKIGERTNIRPQKSPSCHSDVWSVSRVYKKKRQALPNPSDSRSGALSVGPGVVNH